MGCMNMKKNQIENILNEVQKGCNSRKLSVDEVVNFINEVEKITKTIKKYDTENLIQFEYEYHYGDKCAGYSYVNTCIKGTCNDKGTVKDMKAYRDKKAYEIKRINITNYVELPKLLKHLLEKSYGFTGYGNLNL